VKRLRIRKLQFLECEAREFEGKAAACATWFRDRGDDDDDDDDDDNGGGGGGGGGTQLAWETPCQRHVS